MKNMTDIKNIYRTSRNQANSQPPKYRSVWISDVHLGARGCQANKLSAFLDAHSCETLYMVGDIVDGWRLKRDFYWPQEHTNVVRKILGQSRHGTKVYWVTGNHDEFLRRFVTTEVQLGNIHIVNSVSHKSVQGRNLLVIHGDIHDAMMCSRGLLPSIGSFGYRLVRRGFRSINKLRVKMGFSYWSLASFARKRTERAARLVADYVDVMTDECIRRGYDGVICGHIHQANICDINGVLYYNCGDWVESCTALVETFDGSIELVHWTEADSQVDKVVPMDFASGFDMG